MDVSGLFLRRVLWPLCIVLGLGACASRHDTDPMMVNVVGIDTLPGDDLELRLAVKLRVQNPNDAPVQYRGVALNLDVNGRPFATGVSKRAGEIGGYSEQVISVPMSVSAFSMLRQALAVNDLLSLEGLPYSLRGKLADGLFGTTHFHDEGVLNFKGPTPP
ncbi:LEA type 2 family protein [Pseudomonas cremoricolorata]|uniref:LEA type 2 family protein n=1 Tax=Pseudomonas cremoricolorata TaxID=157783 RepID=UPI00048B4F2C|nr:LEA type 2 family protein [Pseudomonas cremoricolorata]